jgi:peroxiredoxin
MSPATCCPRLRRWLLLTAFVAGAMPWLSGCEKSDPGPISARSSQYQVADSPKDQPAEPAAGTPAVVPDQPAGVAPDGSTPAAKMPPEAAPAPSVAGQPPAPPAFDPADNLDLNNLDLQNLPNSEVKLMALLEVLQARQPTGRTQQEQMDDFFRIQFSRVKVAEKLWDLSQDKATRLGAVRAKLDALRVMSRFGVPDIEKQLNTFCRELQQHEDAEIALLARLMLFDLAIDELASGAEVDMSVLSEELKNLAAAAGKTPEAFMVLSQGADAFLRAEQRDAAIEAYRTIGESFRDSDDKELAADAAVMVERVRMLEAGMDVKLQAAAMGEPDSEGPLLATLGALMTAEGAGTGTLVEMGQVAMVLEMTDNNDLARKVYEQIAAAFQGHSDPKLAAQAVRMADNGLKHLNLIGKPFEVTGVKLDGTPFDWSEYRGKVVLVSFWTWSDPCLYEISNIIQVYRQYRDQGFAVVGVNLDEDTKTVQRFMDIQPLPWTIVISADPEKQGPNNPLAVSSGVDLLPFAVLLDREGKVIALHARQDRLRQKCKTLLGSAGRRSAWRFSRRRAGSGSDRAARACRGRCTRRGAPGDAPGAVPPADGQSLRMNQDAEVFFVSTLMAPADEAADDEAADDSAAEIEAINPYSPRGDLSPDELVDFIFNMQDKPKSIQERPGFSAALIEAADRILAADSSDKQRRTAAETKFKLLHDQASLGNETADAALVAFVEQMKDSQDEKIAAQVRFFQLERKAIDVDQLPIEQVPELLAELKKYLADQKLDDRHVRMASYTVRAVNRLEDADRREEHFQEFGELVRQERWEGTRPLRQEAGQETGRGDARPAGQAARRGRRDDRRKRLRVE